MGGQGDTGKANEGVMRTQVCRGNEHKCCCCHQYFTAAGNQDPDHTSSSSSSTKTSTSATFFLCLLSFVVSIAGGFMLIWWKINYHPTNSQLWMVPFGLVFFSTPIFIWFTTILSDFVCSISCTTATPFNPNRPDHDSHVRDLEAGS